MAGSKSWKRASAGTYEDESVSKVVLWVFLILALAVVCIPALGMLLPQGEDVSKSDDLADLPSLIDDGDFNEGYLQGLGDYFDDHFAFREEAITANAITRSLFGVSATDQVVLGTDGWLYYGGTLPDYLGQSSLTHRELKNIAHNLKLVQGYVESCGARFAFMIAPNKNSLDDANMPYYYLPYEGESNVDRLVPYLDEAEVTYVDLFTLFRDRLEKGERFHYLKEDSHWDNYWALFGANALEEALGREELPIDPASAVKQEGFVGDLEAMLYPTSDKREDNYYYDGYNDEEGMAGSRWAYVEGSAVTGSSITTAGEGDEGRLLFFRDSFGNALIPYLASAYGTASFSKLIPYDISQVPRLQADAVAIERAERHLPYLATAAPIMPSPRYDGRVIPKDSVELEASVEVDSNGPFAIVRGTLASDLADSVEQLRVVVTSPDGTSMTFIPFLLSEVDDQEAIMNDRGFTLFIQTGTLDVASSDIHVYSVL